MSLGDRTFHLSIFFVSTQSETGTMLPQLRSMKLVWAGGAILLLTLVGWDFAARTTFLDDDYVFRAYGLLESSPWLAFVADKHGGEYYRPIPMLL